MGSEDTSFQQDAPAAGSEVKTGNGEARQTMHEAAEYSRTAARRITTELKAQSRSIIKEQRDRITGSLDILAEAIKDAGEKLREQRSRSLADATDAGAKTIEDVSGFIKENNPGKIVEQVESFARRQPALFIGAALAAGIILGQLISSPGKPRGSVRVLGQGGDSIEHEPARDEEKYHGRH